MKRVLVLMLSFLLLISSSIVLAEESEGYKDETIYVILNGDGSINNTIVVNGLHGLNKDYGAYSALENLSNLEDLSYENGQLNLSSSPSHFYYSGQVVNPELPWKFELSYFLDGQEISISDLPGATGHLEIHMDVQKGNEDLEMFFDSFALQVSLAIPKDVISSLEAEYATVIDAAGQKQIAYVVLPGQEKTLKLSADVHDFEMSAISLNAIKMVFDFQVDTSQLSNELTALKEAVSQLNSGAVELSEGLNQLSDGLNTYTRGLRAYADGVNAFADEGQALVGGLSEIVNGLKGMSQNGLPLKVGVEALEENAFIQANGQLIQMGMTDVVLTKENYQMVLSDPAFAPLLEQLEQTVQLTQGLQDYFAGVDQLAAGSNSILTGLSEYVGNAKALGQSANELYLGASEINEGLKALVLGMKTYQEGTETFEAETNQMDAQMAESIEQMLSEFNHDDSKLISYTSSENQFVHSVQFLMKTEAVKIEVEDHYVEPIPKKESFWTKVKQLIQSIF
ncbi:MAG: hypothetical protein JXR88_18960 [Clostridia bacterium]|nr:hypothetical protein [Clostridia bacterium]